jgi:hypothetical protein
MIIIFHSDDYVFIVMICFYSDDLYLHDDYVFHRDDLLLMFVFFIVVIYTFIVMSNNYITF